MSRLQKWILSELAKNHRVDNDYALIHFYGYEKRTRNYSTAHDWFKDGQEVRASGEVYGIEGGGLITISDTIVYRREAFSHSVANLRRRGFITGTPRTRLKLTDSGKEYSNKHHLSIKDTMLLIDSKDYKVT